MQRRNYYNFVQGGVQNPGTNQNQNMAQQASPNINNISVTRLPLPAAPNIEPVATPVPAPPATVTTATPQLAKASSAMDLSVQPEDQSRSMSESDLMRLKKINFKKKVSGKEKRVRQNRKLYRMLTPRNAIAALNELHGQGMVETKFVPTLDNQFEAEMTINNVRHVGVGRTKMQAKNAASEKALRDLVISKLQQVKSQEISNQAAAGASTSDDDMAEDVPMMQLASFALHKLFSEWETEGYQIPLLKSNAAEAATINAPGPSTIPAKTPKLRTELPPNSETLHPVMLLKLMRPFIEFNDLGSVGITPEVIHTAGAQADGKSFTAEGRTKKDARRQLAMKICWDLFKWKGAAQSM